MNGKSIHLTLTEFRLLADMVRNCGRVRSRDTLMSRVWNYDAQAIGKPDLGDLLDDFLAKAGLQSG